MKKILSIILTGVLTVMAGLSVLGCGDDSWKDYVYQEGDFTLEIEVDKTEASVGDTIEITATFKNLSGRDLPILFMDHYTRKKTNKIEHMIMTGIYEECDEHRWIVKKGGFPISRVTLKNDAKITLKAKDFVREYKYEQSNYYEAVAIANFYIGRETDKNRITINSNIIVISVA